MDWSDSLQFEVNAEHLSDLSPAIGTSVRLRLKVWKEAPLHGIELRVILSGHSDRRPMRRTEIGRRFAWWEVDLPVPHAGMIHWHFLCHTADGPLFFTRAGVQRVNPTEDRDWTLIPGFQGADWVAGAVFYQIFPDRFRNGDPRVGRAAHEYQFDDGQPRVMDWSAAPLEYPEGRCLDFFNGDLVGIAERLDYLEDLGVTALYLTPVFHARTTHRYDCIDYFQVDPALGGDAALAHLGRAARARGIRLILDVSINHTGSAHPWHQAARDDPDAPERDYYYPDERGGFQCWWGIQTLPQLNYGSDALRDLIWQGDRALLRHWLRPPFEVDGWRFDVGNMTGRHGRDQFGHGIWRSVRQAIKSERPDAYIVGEHWEDAIDYQLGDQWDGTMNYFGCASPLRRWAGEQLRFEALGPDFPPQPGRPISGQDLELMLRQTLDRFPNQHLRLQLNMLDSHDIHRLHHGPGFDWELYRGVVMLQFLLPGAPNIWYGDEVGLAGHARSVEGCRYPMEWRMDHWDLRFRDLYRTLARLKRAEPVLADGAHRFLSTGQCHLAFARHGRGKAYVALLNRAQQASRVTLPIAPMGLAEEAEECFDARRFPVVDGVLVVNLAPRENLLLRLALSE